MTQDEKKELAKIVADSITKNQRGLPDVGKTVDWLFKALIAILVWMGSGVKSDVDTMKTEISKMATERQYTQREMDNFKEFLKEPRFTKNDFDAQILPLTNQINRNTTELNVRGPVLDDIASRLIKLEYKVEQYDK